MCTAQLEAPLEVEHGICCRHYLIILSIVSKPYSGGLPIIRLSPLRKTRDGTITDVYISILFVSGCVEEIFIFFFLALIRSEIYETASYCASYSYATVAIKK